MTINWFSSINATASDTIAYYDVIQSAITSACPVANCPPTFAAARVVRINWQNLIYELPYVNQSIVSIYCLFIKHFCFFFFLILQKISFSAYLINTYQYDSSSYSYPFLRSYIAFDYSNLTSSLYYLRPFVGMLFNHL